MAKKEYTAPTMEQIEFQLEQGFALSEVSEPTNFSYKVEDGGEGY